MDYDDVTARGDRRGDRGRDRPARRLAAGRDRRRGARGGAHRAADLTGSPARGQFGRTSASRRRALPPITFGDLVVAEAGVDQRVGERRPARWHRIGMGDRAVEVGAEADMVDAGDIHGVADRPGDRGRVVATAGGRARTRSPSSPPVVGDARRWASVRLRLLSAVPRNPGMRGDDRPGRHRQDVVDRRRRGMRDVDDHPAGLHPAGPSRARPASGRPCRRRAPTRQMRCRRSGSATSSESRRRRRRRRSPGRHRAHVRLRSTRSPAVRRGSSRRAAS